MTGISDRPRIRTLADQVATSIVERISSGRYRAGQSLPSQRELARELGVGLSAIREAMQRLQSMRVLSSHQGRGTVVESVRWAQMLLEPSLAIVAIERDMLSEVWEARNAIEMETARLAGLRRTEDDLEALRKVIAEAGDGPTTYETNHRLNKAFHAALARAAHNQFMCDMLAPLLEVDLTANRTIFDVEISRRSWLLHRAIYDAVAARDLAGVVSAMRRHAEELEAQIRQVDQLLGQT
jgi:GntR family transcriptional repressor for pyruvate dehydrogenase complex